MKYVLITGAFGGMGSATVELFLNKGFTVFALDKKIPDIKNRGNLIPIEVDVTDESSVLSAFEKVKSLTDNLYAIIHFAGIYLLDSLVEVSYEIYQKAFKVNVFGAFLINKIFRPLLKEGSRVLMITSELAPLDPLPFTGIYAITKSALDKYAYSLRMELQLLNVSVSVLRAGAVDTGMITDSVKALDKFCNSTEIYPCNGKKFKKIVDSVESKKIPTMLLAKKVFKIICKKRPAFCYKINRNPLLLLLNILPKRLQCFIVKKILK